MLSVPARAPQQLVEIGRAADSLEIDAAALETVALVFQQIALAPVARLTHSVLPVKKNMFALLRYIALKADPHRNQIDRSTACWYWAPSSKGPAIWNKSQSRAAASSQNGMER